MIEAEKYVNSPCLICGQADYEWGYLQADSLKYFSDGSGFLQRNFYLKYRVRARKCRSCSNIQLFDIDE